MEPTDNEAALKQELIETLGIGALPEAERDTLLEKIMEAMMKRIFVATAEKLDEEGLKEYKRLLDDDAVSEEAIKRFLEENIPEYNGFVESVSREFVEHMKQAANMATEE